MTEPSDLTRTVQEFTDTVRGLRRENLTKEEFATIRAALLELNWLIEGTEK